MLWHAGRDGLGVIHLFTPDPEAEWQTPECGMVHTIAEPCPGSGLADPTATRFCNVCGERASVTDGRFDIHQRPAPATFEDLGPVTVTQSVEEFVKTWRLIASTNVAPGYRVPAGPGLCPECPWREARARLAALHGSASTS